MYRDERDACAIVAFVDKQGHSTHANIVRAIDALRKMGHRSGDINGEGDGCGIMTDIPRVIWARRLAGLGLSPHLAESSHFFVGHLLLPALFRSQARQIMARALALLSSGREACLAKNASSVSGPRSRTRPA